MNCAPFSKAIDAREWHVNHAPPYGAATPDNPQQNLLFSNLPLPRVPSGSVTGMLTDSVKKELQKVIGSPDGAGAQLYISKVGDLVRKYKNVTRIEASLSEIEIRAKSALIRAIESRNLIDSKSTVVIWGSGYGSILIPYFESRVAKVIAIDKDDEVVRFAKNKLFRESTNVDFITDDIFATHRSFYMTTNLIVNASCDYMRPMREWPWFQHGALATDRDFPKGSGDRIPSRKRVFNSPKLATDVHFAFQSSNLVGVEGRINCVKSLDAFKLQLPSRAEVQHSDETEVEGGKVFTLVGKFK